MKTNILCIFSMLLFGVIFTSYIQAESNENVGDASFEVGYKDGYRQGFENGYRKGYSGDPDAAAPQVDVLIGQTEKYQQGFQAGIANGFKAGYPKGIGDRRKDEKGTDYRKGYDIGYQDGSSGAIYDVPAGDFLVEENVTGYHEGYFDGVRDKAASR